MVQIGTGGEGEREAIASLALFLQFSYLASNVPYFLSSDRSTAPPSPETTRRKRERKRRSEPLRAREKAGEGEGEKEDELFVSHSLPVLQRLASLKARESGPFPPRPSILSITFALTSAVPAARKRRVSF